MLSRSIALFTALLVSMVVAVPAQAALMTKKKDASAAAAASSTSDQKAPDEQAPGTAAQAELEAELDMSEQDLQDEKEMQDIERELAREADDLFDPAIDIPQNPNTFARAEDYQVAVNPNVPTGAVNPNLRTETIAAPTANPNAAFAVDRVIVPANPNAAAVTQNPNLRTAPPANPNIGAVVANPNARE